MVSETQTHDARTESAHAQPQTQARWLVVGDTATADLAREMAAQHESKAVVVEAPHFLAALGELAKASVDVVIGSTSQVHGLAEATVASLRELAPKARLIITASSHERGEAQQALAAGFDQLLVLPTDAKLFLRAVGLGQGENPASVFAKAMNQVQAEIPDDTALGDVDLVDAILRGKGELPELAMRLIAGQSGLDGVALTPQRDEIPTTHACAEVTHHKRSLGFLHAPPPVTKAQLSVWSDWAAHWLVMHEQFEHFKDQAMRDELTSSWNRRYFNRFLKRVLEWAHRDRSQVTLMVFDIDDFKLYNDRYGHAAGDEILHEAARLMRTVCREHDVIARIGGDEFAVIFWDAEAPRHPNSQHPQTVVSAANRFQRAICSHAFPKLLEEAPGTLTISGGLASFPWDGQTASALLAKADEMALESKRNGKNAVTFGPGAAQLCQRNGLDPSTHR